MMQFDRSVALTIVLLWVPVLNVLLGGFLLLTYLAHMFVDRRFLQMVFCFGGAFFLFFIFIAALSNTSYFLYALYCLGCVFFIGWCTAVISETSKQAMNKLKKSLPGKDYDFIFGSDAYAGVDIQSKTIVFADKKDVLEIPFSDIITFKHDYDWKPSFGGTKSYKNIRVIFETRRIATPLLTIYVNTVEEAEVTMARLKAVLT